METATWGFWSASIVGLTQEGQLPGSVPGLEGTPASSPGAGAGAPTGGGNPPPPTLLSPMVIMLGLVVVFMIFTTMMSSRKEKKRVAAMLGSLKRGDRVQTVGGMIGTVHEVKDDSIVLKIDDVSGAKAHFSRTAVQGVLKSARSEAKPEQATAE